MKICNGVVSLSERIPPAPILVSGDLGLPVLSSSPPCPSFLSLDGVSIGFVTTFDVVGRSPIGSPLDECWGVIPSDETELIGKLKSLK